MSDTPRTDAVTFVGNERHSAVSVSSDFARQLERELAAMTAANQQHLIERNRLGVELAGARFKIEELTVELSNLRATAEDYRIQACTPDNCRRNQ
jgi:hypothetical protein